MVFLLSFFFSCFVIFPFVVHFIFSFPRLRSKRFSASSSKKLGREQKNNNNKGGGGGEEGNGCPQTHDFEKLRSLTNAASDWCGAGSVDYLALETSINRSIFNLQSVRKAKSKNNK